MNAKDPRQLQDLRKLKQLADLLLDHRLAQVRRAAEAKAQSEAALAALAQPAPFDGLEGAAADLAALAYQRWADKQRASINQVLARQTHDWLEAAAEARIAFGKAEALGRLANDKR